MSLRGNQRATIVNSGGTYTNAATIPYPVIVYGFTILHTSGNAGFLQMFDAASAPADGTVPLFVHHLQSNSDHDYTLPIPLYFENGLYMCESSTGPTKTLDAGEHLFISVMIEQTFPSQAT